MKQFATLRLAQTASKVGEQAPLATVCCNACRTCVTTNLLTLAMAGITGAGVAVTRFVRRL
ncbi:MAG TPA: hypothetical protein VIL77_14015 [Gaiellaceae bacterium]